MCSCMSKKIFTFLVALLSATMLRAQQEDHKNVVIDKLDQEIVFVKGDAGNPVNIRQTIKKSYRCNGYRTSISIAEFYNDKERIDEVSASVNGDKHRLNPSYDYYDVNGIFYSDARVCTFSLPLEKVNSRSVVTLKKTIIDPRYFTALFFMDEYGIEEHTLRIIVPSWVEAEIREFNFSGYDISKNTRSENNATIYEYRIKNIPPLPKEEDAPGPTYFVPHVLTLCKYATPGEKIVYFPSVKEQYGWYHSLLANIADEGTVIRQKALEITAGLSDVKEKVKALFYWVQDNIRYIAFENGIAGFKPEKATEVLKKKYGDCKGMANLLTELIRSLGIDARRCWIGTRHIAYDYSFASLAIDNHMICAWMEGAKPHFLDATEKYISFEDLAERIQNRQTLVENGKDYIITHVPARSYAQNKSHEKRELKLEGNSLKGKVIQSWKGENKEWLLTQLNSMRSEKKEQALVEFLSKGKPGFELANLQLSGLSEKNEELTAQYDLVWKDAVASFGKESYIDLDNRRTLASFTIDTAERKLAYWFPFKDHVIFESDVMLPEGSEVKSLPSPLMIDQPLYSFRAAYSFSKNRCLTVARCCLKMHLSRLMLLLNGTQIF
jgi:transglutaminase-like putative cysteine protease